MFWKKVTHRYVSLSKEIRARGYVELATSAIRDHGLSRGGCVEIEES